MVKVPPWQPNPHTFYWHIGNCSESFCVPIMKIIKRFKILYLKGPWNRKGKTKAIIRMFRTATGIKVSFEALFETDVKHGDIGISDDNSIAFQ